MPRSHRSLVVATGIVVFAGGAAVGATGGDGAPSQRQEQVAQRGSRVMPFDLDATTHRFIKREDGGDQIVVADVPDPRQMQLIRQHLREEARAFARGEFDDPAAIHGTEMPGLATLRTAGDELSVGVENRSDGALLTYRTADPAVRDALHDWFDAQVSDHGAHASSE